MLEPIKAAMAPFRAAAQGSANGGDGSAQLRARSSQRLFMDGLLMDDVEAWQKQCEPDPIRQLEEDFNVLMEHAEAAHQVLLQAVGPRSRAGPEWRIGERYDRPQAARSALFAMNPGVKSRSAAQMKAFVRYGPSEGPRRFRHLVDLSRVTIVFSDCATLRSGLEQILDEFEVVDVRNHYLPNAVGLIGERYVQVCDAAGLGEADHGRENRVSREGLNCSTESSPSHLGELRSCPTFTQQLSNSCSTVSLAARIRPISLSKLSEVGQTLIEFDIVRRVCYMCWPKFEGYPAFWTMSAKPWPTSTKLSRTSAEICQT